MARCSCREPDAELRKRKSVSGTVFQQQCQKCGGRVGLPIRGGPRWADLPSVMPWNLNLRLSRPFSGQNSKKQEYRKHLRSPAWTDLRKRVLEQTGFKCQVCGGDASQVHHMTYERFRQEQGKDLLAVCADCHQMLHGGDAA